MIATDAITTPVVRYHGGKFRLAPWVIQHFPPHRCYVEPFGGAASVLMHKPRSYAEVYNDLDGDMVNLFRVLQDADQRERLLDLLVVTPYARAEFDLAWRPAKDPVERSRRLIIRAQMGYGSAGATKSTTGFRLDTARCYGTAQSLWARYPDQVGAVASRLQGVLIDNRDAIEVMHQHDATDTLHYVDPPYMQSTRSSRPTSGRGYRHEMDDESHHALLRALQELRGMVVISHYPNPVYATVLADWHHVTTQVRFASQRGGGTRTDGLWVNEACWRALESDSLFATATA